MVTDRFRIGKTYLSVTTPDDTIQRIEDAVKNGLNTYLCFSNPRTVDLATKDPNYREVYANSYMNVPDAEPLMWAARLWGVKGIQKTMAPVVFERMLTNPASGLKHFLLGDTDETLAKIKEKAALSNANIVGSYSPPFCKLDEYDFEGIAKIINDSGADCVWTSLRAPKQDYFAVRLLPYTDKKVFLGVGASFRSFLGEYKIAPKWIQRLGLQGVYWGRKGQPWGKFITGYLSDNMPYFWHISKIPFMRLAGKKYND